MSRVIHFEIPVEEPERAVDFYTRVFGWQFQGWGEAPSYWLIQTGDTDAPGIDGGMFRREEPFSTPVDIVDVESVDEIIVKIEAAGGTTVRPKSAVPGVGWVAYFRDTEGNLFGVLQSDEAAA